MASIPHKNDAQIASKTKAEGSDLDFKHSPGYASYIIDNHLEEYTRYILKVSREEEVPLLKFLEHFSENELIEFVRESSRKFFQAFASNEVEAYVRENASNYRNDQIPVLERDDVVAEDISKVSLVRRKALMKFLPYYTQDLTTFTNILEEIDHYIAKTEEASFSAFIEIQQERIRRVNAQLAQRQEDLLEAQELADMGSFLWDIKNDKSESTPGVKKILQTSAGTEDFFQHVYEEDREKVKEALQHALDTNGIFESEYRYIKNNQEKRIWARGIVKFDDNGDAETMRGTIMDISKRHRLLQKLQESEALNKETEAITHMGNWSWDVETGKVVWSDEMYRLYGLEPQSEKITFDRFMSFIHPDDRERRIAEVQEALVTGKVKDYIIRVISNDNQHKVIKGKGKVVTDRNNEATRIIGSCQDITLEHTLNEELKSKEEYLTHLISSAPDCIIVFDEEEKINLWNPKTEEVFGYTEEEVIGKKFSSTIFPERYMEEYERHIAEFLKNSSDNAVSKSLSLTAVDKKGTELFTSLTISKSQEPEGPIFIVFLRDVTAQRQTKAELESKTQQLQMTNQSLASKNQELERLNKELNSFNYVASHDLQEPLRKIQTFAGRIVDKCGTDLHPVATDYLERITTSTNRMKVLIEDLLMFSQATASESNFEPINLNVTLKEAESTLSTTIEEKNATIEADSLPIIEGIPFQFQQLFLNLLSNSLKYSRKEVNPHIRISVDKVPKEDLTSNIEPSAELYHKISIQDNGVGFDPEHSERIFGLFQRLYGKQEFSGTGIGLAICKKIVFNHNGFIEADSVPQKGSTFTFYLPLNSQS